MRLMMDGKTLPFKLERGRRGCLAEQIAALLREAIVTGYYKPGEVLPPIRELAHMLDVGRVNVERAIAKLTDEGLINPRPKIGSVVCGTDTPLWKGQVLIVVPPGSANHYINVIGAALRDALAEAGYLFLMASVPRKTDGSFDFSFLFVCELSSTVLFWGKFYLCTLIWHLYHLPLKSHFNTFQCMHHVPRRRIRI